MQNEELIKERKSSQNNIFKDKLKAKTNQTTTKTKTSYLTSSYCTDAPIETDIGRDIYPINPKYNNLKFLGQLFTAYGCGPARISKLFGVKGDMYTLGVIIKFKKQPTRSLINTYLSIGFRCYNTDPNVSCKSETETKRIILDKTIKIEELMKLEPYYDYFETDDCVNCG